MMLTGDTVVKILKTGPYECAVVGLVRVEAGVARFGDDKSLAYDARTGREIDPAPGMMMAGISSRLVPMDGVE